MKNKVALSFPEHTKEKLEAIKYYYDIWFDIVKRQKCYIIDAFAGVGYCDLKEKKERILGSALLAIDLFNKDEYNHLKLYLININKEEYEVLKNNIVSCLSRNKIKANLDSEIIIINDDWSSVIEKLVSETNDGISFFLLDPYGIESLPWDKLNKLIQKAKSEFNYKESGFEVLINWAWHKIRRDLGYYYSYYLKDPNNIPKTKFKNLNAFFGPVNWENIAKKYFNVNDDLMNELIFEYSKLFFNYFKYVKVHAVHSRKKRKEPYLKDKGKVKYFLIFASNYYDALDIMEIKFKESREMKIFFDPSKNQTSLEDFGLIVQEKTKEIEIPVITIEDKINSLERELQINLYTINKEIIRYLFDKKNYDYGCFDFVLHNKFHIDSDHYSINYLIQNNILAIRDKRAKTGLIGKYYYLIHPKLVDRSEYLFFNDKVYDVKDGSFTEIKNND